MWKMSILDCVKAIERSEKISKFKDEAAIIFIFEQMKSNPELLVQDLLIKSSDARIQVARLLSSSEFSDFLEREKVDLELADSLATCIEKYYSDTEFEEEPSITAHEDRDVMMKLVIPYVIKKLMVMLDIDMSELKGDYDGI